MQDYFDFFDSNQRTQQIELSKEVIKDIDYFVPALLDDFVEAADVAENDSNFSSIIGEEALCLLEAVDLVKYELR